MIAAWCESSTGAATSRPRFPGSDPGSSSTSLRRSRAIRGLHGEQTNKFVGVVAGGAFGAYLDARPTSPTYGKVETVALHQGVGVLVSAGICNGFQAAAPGTTQYLYCFDQEWQPGMAGTSVNPLDRDLAIRWPIVIDPSDRTLLSEKDAALPCLSELGPEAEMRLCDPRDR
jgi:dTDP-4-dehydrorhamnose 3,5-epimerase